MARAQLIIELFEPSVQSAHAKNDTGILMGLCRHRNIDHYVDMCVLLLSADGATNEEIS